MSFSLDANILLYASDRSSSFHSASRDFLEQCVTNQELCYLAWPTLLAYLRIATHPRIFTHPLSPSEVLANIEALLNLSHVRSLSEGEGFLEIYREVTGEIPVRGNLVPDAHLVALLKQHEVKKLYTADSDFRKFSCLDVRNPFS